MSEPFTSKGRARAGATKRSRTQDDILKAAESLFDELPADAVSVQKIADKAHVSVASVYGHFGTKGGIATAVFGKKATAVNDRTSAELAENRSPVEVLKEHLARLARLANANQGLLALVLETIHRHTFERGPTYTEHDPRAFAPLPTPIAETLIAGREAGLVRNDIDLKEAANVVTNTLLVRVRTRPEDSPDELAHFIASILIDGLAAHVPERRDQPPPG